MACQNLGADPQAKAGTVIALGREEGLEQECQIGGILAGWARIRPGPGEQWNLQREPRP